MNNFRYGKLLSLVSITANHQTKLLHTLRGNHRGEVTLEKDRTIHLYLGLFNTRGLTLAEQC